MVRAPGVFHCLPAQITEPFTDGPEKSIGDELERALGRKALEVDILKKFCELKELRLPEGM